MSSAVAVVDDFFPIKGTPLKDLKELNTDGVKNLVNYMLESAYRERYDNCFEAWLESDECEYACYCAQKDFELYKKAQREAHVRWVKNRALQDKKEREFWYSFEVSKYGQNTFGNFLPPEIKKLNTKPNFA